MKEGYIMYCFIFQSPYEGRIYNVLIICGERYPEERPYMKFMTKIKLSCVQDTGEVRDLITITFYAI